MTENPQQPKGTTFHFLISKSSVFSLGEKKRQLEKAPDFEKRREVLCNASGNVARNCKTKIVQDIKSSTGYQISDSRLVPI